MFLRDLWPNIISGCQLDMGKIEKNCAEVCMSWFYIEMSILMIKAEVAVQCGVSPNVSPKAQSCCSPSSKDGSIASLWRSWRRLLSQHFPIHGQI